LLNFHHFFKPCCKQAEPPAWSQTPNSQFASRAEPASDYNRKPVTVVALAVVRAAELDVPLGVVTGAAVIDDELTFAAVDEKR
jgi:hypothetical protein